MWILSKDKQCMINSDTADSIYTVTTGIRVRFTRTNKDLTIGEYESSQIARLVLESLHNAMRLGKGFKMPDDRHAETLCSVVNATEKERAANGKKTVRRGGS